MGDPIPAIAEHEATGALAQTFDDIKATLGVPVVNLIWRHLATIDGGLDWAWGAAKPIYTSGQAARSAKALFDRLPVAMPEPLAPGALQAVGVTAEDLATVRAVAAGYNRGNGLNLLALGALVVAPAGPVPSAAGAPAEAASAPIPRVLSQGDVEPHVWELVLALNRFGSRPEEPILATMYRHLAYWPGLLALMHAGFAPLEADGRLRAATATTRSMAMAESARLAHLRAEAGPAPEEAVAAVEEFTRHVIARMVLICFAFSRWVG
ncbi:hypothetical protein T8K17_00970 [Thalassobaculum sp. OXR-137]|uniref:hypothetical protein n=1 Tax=Thalassobaculum sp. OXR-137 TaxID=3100173 RepID=UPI002AC991DB|nr:hypothetical protein [Thalassobaculum sp. OXR-137]WPZ34719.1 hypothetical protein T8K17_00970 [Thalassobaculum sp. OXR-137]